VPNNEEKIRHLEMIQSVISRMASNSFLLKGWTVTLVVGLLAFANLKDMESKFAIIAFIPVLFFWLLDSFFLYQDRLYRKLYEHATTLENANVDFSLNPSAFKEKFKWSWIRQPLEFTCKVHWACAVFSKTIVLFYIPIILVIALVLFSKCLIG